MACASAVDCTPSASISASAQWRLTIFAGRQARMKSRKATLSGSDHGAGPGRFLAIRAPVESAVAIQIDAARVVARAARGAVGIGQRQDHRREILQLRPERASQKILQQAHGGRLIAMGPADQQRAAARRQRRVKIEIRLHGNLPALDGAAEGTEENWAPVHASIGKHTIPENRPRGNRFHRRR